MFTYDFVNDKYLDVSRLAQEDSRNKTLRTFFDPNDICKKNPMIILRALKLKIRHDLSLDPLLEKAMKDYANLIFDGRYSDIELIIARENVRKEGKNKADELFCEFGVENINSVQ
jgi:tRNA nucleotidyltransferase/poly(A) polymerase